MAVNLRPLSAKEPLWLDEEAYQQLVQRTQGGWSFCRDETEWLAKLHYLRQGLADGKMAPDQFKERESRLVTGWLKKYI